MGAIIVKSIETPRFKVEIQQLDTGAFVVIADNFETGEEKISQDILDYNQASYQFEVARVTFEGN